MYPDAMRTSWHHTMAHTVDITQHRLSDAQIGIPTFPEAELGKEPSSHYTLFDLSSHSRARDAIAFGLKLRHNDFHVFVVGEDRTGRMTSTLTYLNDYIKTLPAPSDWIYLNNFKQPNKPLPFKLPNGMGCKLFSGFKDHIKNLESILKKTFSSPSYLKQIDKISMTLNQQIQDDMDRVKEFAEKHGFEIIQTPEGFHAQEALDESSDNTNNSLKPLTSAEKKKKNAHLTHIKDQLNRLSLAISLASRHILKQIKELQESLAKNATRTLWQKFRTDFSLHLDHWIDDFEADVLENIDLFLEEDEEQSKNHFERYYVNLIINNKGRKHPLVLLESEPTHETLFGSIKNRISASGTYETNFTMIRPGALHFANEGILVLRAEAIAKDPEVWEHLKAALRDKKIRIQDQNREHTGSSLIDAPDPKSIPLDLQVFIVGQPTWYYSFFFSDPQFRIYFKIKAEIDADLEITPHNVLVYGNLIQKSAQAMGATLTPEAIHYLTQCSSRWAGHRERLSARFEIVHDVVAEAFAFAQEDNSKLTEKRHIRKSLLGRRIRNARLEDHTYNDILNNTIMIDTTGESVGQINGLTVLSYGDFSFGLPARISARTYAGKLGVVNIERLTDMSGPIQQKGAFILDGYLSGLFAQKFPVSFSCSLTFEQSYSDVEGDSASLAELCAILSSLADTPLRQDIAVTGSVNQFGTTQAVGGIYHKIEGFFEICQRRGLTGTQGVIIPQANMTHLTLKDELVEAIREGQFHIYAVKNVDDALEILTGQPSHCTKGFFGTKRSGVFAKAYEKLKLYHQTMR